MHLYKLVRNERISPTTQLITLENNERGRPFGFQPGQYAAISFWHKGRQTPARCFSVVSSPTDQETLQFSLRVNGHFTRAVEDIKPDDPVKVFGPFGGFIFNTAHDKDVVMLAGGIGITPFMSMIRYISRLETTNKVTLLYSCRTASDIPFADELLQHAYQNRNFHVMFVIGDDDIQKLPSKYAVTGRITPALLDDVTKSSYTDQKFFICGPPPFMKGMTSVLLGKGVSKRQIMTESFSQASHPQSGILKSWPANVYAMSALGLVMGSLFVTVNDLIKNYQTTPTIAQAVNAPYLITNARQQQLDQLVNSIPISANVVISPTTSQSAQAAQNAPAPSSSSTATSSVPAYHAVGSTPATALPSTAPSTSSVGSAGGSVTTPPVVTAPQPVVTPPTTGSGGKTSASSDVRLKENIRYLATICNNIRLYSFSYIGQAGQYVGVMAQDLLGTHPEAVAIDDRGYYLVNYGMLGLRMITLDDWRANRSAPLLTTA